MTLQISGPRNHHSGTISGPTNLHYDLENLYAKVANLATTNRQKRIRTIRNFNPGVIRDFRLGGGVESTPSRTRQFHFTFYIVSHMKLCVNYLSTIWRAHDFQMILQINLIQFLKSSKVIGLTIRAHVNKKMLAAGFGFSS